MKHDIQPTSEESQRWEDFVQRLGAGQRLKDLVRQIDAFRDVDDLELESLREEVRLLNQLANEYTIIVMHRDRKAMVC